MVELPEEVMELLRAHEARQTALVAQVDQLAAAVRELEEWAQMSEDLRSEHA
jgi:hypothetical protein